MGKVIEMKDKHIKKIVTDYDALSERCDEIDLTKKNTEVQDIILDIKHTMKQYDDISGLSAIQVGRNKRVICLNFDGNLRSFVNPVITSVEGFELSREKCHSIPGKEYIRPRHSKIKVTYQTPLGKIESVEFVGMAARVFQHAIDHLDGLLLSDVGLEITKEFDEATDEERAEVINMYLESIDLSAEQIDKDIEKDEEAKKMSDGVKFMNAVKTGKVKLEQIPWTEEEKTVYDEFVKQNKEG